MKVILTGATGMVGEGVLHECLLDPEVEEVLVISRRISGMSHPKLTELVHDNFFDLSSIAERLKGYDACFYCLGISSVGKSEADYTRITYDMTMHMAELLSRSNPGMVFCYITGSGTDSTEQGRSMWARVKGRTENHLLQLPFRAAYMFRPSYIHPTKGLKNTYSYAWTITWLYPLLKPLFPNQLLTMKELGNAMLQVARTGYEKPILQVPDILRLAHQQDRV
ncbi:NAD-dependent epimerase/dehydratase family protein [Paenibacillus filicis]|uniref:NAD-dependent epimerase/dehydratase family protein n=1 Tax=Paenibacillus filicis TaxID=669464 RepID=A0ABU9DUG5_9BACL